MKQYVIHEIRVRDDAMTSSGRGFTELAQFYGSESFRWIRDHSPEEVKTEQAFCDYGYERILLVRARLTEVDYVYWKLKYT